MFYKFFCEKCQKETEIEIALKDYDAEKTKQVCKNCGASLKRKIEWTGIATGNGDGWCGKKGGNVI